MKKYFGPLVVLLAIPAIVLSAVYRDSYALYVIGTIELALIALVINVFVVMYSRRRWFDNPYGRALMYTMLSLAAVSYLSVITAFLGPDWEWRYVVRAFLFGAILIAHARMLQLLITIKDQNARIEEKIDHEELGDTDDRLGDRSNSSG